MFEPNSRYASLETASHAVLDASGQEQEVRYVRRRFFPPLEPLTTIAEHRVVQSDRIDNITARYLGDPTQFWRLCDTNVVISPDELEAVGRTIKIAVSFTP